MGRCTSALNPNSNPSPNPSPSPSPDPDPNQVTKTFGLPLECANLSGYYSKLLFMMLWPIVVVATLIAGYVLKQWYQLLRANRRA